VNYRYDYQFSADSKDFDKVEPWTFTIDGVTLTWAPYAPFIFSDKSEDGDRIAAELNKLISNIDAREDNTFPATTTGPILLATPSAPYTVLYAIHEIYGDEPDLISSSDNAPKMADFVDNDEDSEESPIIY
jgi:hypothetical protein